jgi:AAA ATPase domain
MATGLEIVVAKTVLAHVAKLAASQALPEEKLRRFLGRDPQRLAFQAALKLAFADFRKRHPQYAAALFDETLLTSDAVAPILAACLPTGAPPDARALAAAWQRQMPGRRGTPSETTVTVAADFLEMLGRRLREREEFRLLYHARDAERSALAIEQILAVIRPVFERVLDPKHALSSYVIDFTSHCKERASRFVGRQALIDSIDEVLADRAFPSGYVVIRGEPGVGKTALMSHLVLTRGYVHHFNIRRRGVTSTDLFRQNICAQLLLRYELDDQDLAFPNADPMFLDKALRRAAGAGELPVVIVVDALDEAERTPGTDRLGLPGALPDGVYVVATTRPLRTEGLPLERRARDLSLDDEDEANQRDVLEYAVATLSEDSYAERLAEWDTTAPALGALIAGSASGNFMYAVQVLRDIQSGQLTKDQLDDPRRLPRGLSEYYGLHWELMRAADPARFARLGQPVVAMLAAAREPVPVAKVAEWINARPDGPAVSLPEVEDMLGEWREYLDEEPGEPPRWQIYHESFREFLDAKVNIRAQRERQVDAALAKLPSAPP